MSESSRQVKNIATVWPHQRERSRKSVEQMNNEELEETSQNIWKENCFHRYAKRPNDNLWKIFLWLSLLLTTIMIQKVEIINVDNNQQ